MTATYLITIFDYNIWGCACMGIVSIPDRVSIAHIVPIAVLYHSVGLINWVSYMKCSSVVC